MYKKALIPYANNDSLYGKECFFMPKDSQPDNKRARMEKCNGQTPITEENHQKNKNAKRKSIAHHEV